MALPGSRLIQQAFRSFKAQVQQRIVQLMVPTWDGGIRPDYWDRTFDNYVREGYKKNEIVYACINATAKTASSVSLRVRDKTTKEEIANHPCQLLINRPNTVMTEFDFWTATISSLMLAGISYWQKIRKGSGKVYQLWPVRPDWVQPIITNQGLQGYKIIIHGIPVAMIDPADMLVFKLYDPLDIFGQQSPIEVIARIVDIDNALTDFLKMFMQKGAMPPAVLMSKQKLTDDAVGDIQRRWAERYGGHDNWLKPAVLDSDASYQRIGVTLDELRFGELGSRTASRICMVYSIPPIIVGTEVGLDRGTYSNYDQSRRQWWEDSLGAQYKQLGNGIQTQLVDVDYDADVVVEWDFSKVPALQEERNGRWSRATAACTAGVITVNMALIEMGLPTVGKEGDVFLRNASIIAVPNNPADDVPNMEGVGTDEPVEDDVLQTDDEAKSVEVKEFASDDQRKWFFANNPEFAAQGSMPTLQEGADREAHRQALETFAENRKNRVANHLWDTDMIKYDDQGKVAVDPDKVKANAADLVKDARDATVSRRYLVSSFAQTEGHTGTDQQLESRLNAVYGDKARATLLAAHVGGVKLTDAQNTRLQSMAHGNYLNDKYSQYASGNNGTLIGVQHERLQSMSADAQYQREENRRNFRTNIRKSDDVTDIETKEFDSDAQRRAFFGLLGHGDLSNQGGSDNPAMTPRRTGQGVISEGEELSNPTPELKPKKTVHEIVKDAIHGESRKPISDLLNKVGIHTLSGKDQATVLGNLDTSLGRHTAENDLGTSRSYYTNPSSQSSNIGGLAGTILNNHYRNTAKYGDRTNPLSEKQLNVVKDEMDQHARGIRDVLAYRQRQAAKKSDVAIQDKSLTNNDVPQPADTQKVVGRKIPTPEALRVVPFTSAEKDKIFEHYHDVKVKVGK